MTYAELIARAMKDCGKLRNQQIYSRVRRRARQARRRLPSEWKAIVRNTLQRHSKQSRKFCHPYLFIHHERNIWECRK